MNIGNVARALQAFSNRSHESTCYKLKGVAAVLLPEVTYIGVSGGKKDPCTENDSCRRRYSGSPVDEYNSCPSLCAEGDAIMTAEHDGNNVNGATLVSTHSPCERCTLLMIDRGIVRVYFGQYKNGQPREKDEVNISAMVYSGIKVNLVEMDTRDSQPRIVKQKITANRKQIEDFLENPENARILATLEEKN